MFGESESLIYRVDDIEVDTTRGCIVRGGQEVPLKPKAFRVLVHLLKERDRLVSKEELMDLFWTDTAVTDDALTQCIARLRRALGDNPRNPTYLKTVPRMGYRFVGPVQEIFPGTIAGSDAAVEPQLVGTDRLMTERPGLQGWRIAWVLAGILIAGSLTGAAFWTATSLYSPHPAARGRRVVAILPFENRSGQSDLDWLREGLPDMLSTTFVRSKSLAVLSREQVYAHRKRGENPGIKVDLAFAHAAQAQAAVTGSFSRLGNSMRVDVRMFDTNTGSLLGADEITVDRPDRILTQVNLLAERLAGRFAPQPQDQDRSVLGSLMTNNLEAYRYYSLGLEKAEAMQTPEAIALFEKAVALDPGFVMAQARIGYAYAVTAPNIERGRPYLERAFRMSGKLTDRDRRHIIAWYVIANQDYRNAIRRYTELLNEYPNDAEACFRLAMLLRGESRQEQALEYLHRADAIAPEDPKIYNALSAVYSELGRHADAIMMAERYRALAPDDANAYDSLGLSCYMAGQYERALEAYGQALAIKPYFPMVSFHRALLYAAMGKVKQAVRESLLEAERDAAHQTGCRGWEQAAFLLWRSGKAIEAKTLAGRSLSNCDPRLLQMCL